MRASLQRLWGRWRGAAMHPGLRPAKLRGEVALAVDPTAQVKCGEGVVIAGGRLAVAAGARLELGAGTILRGVNLVLGPGAVFSTTGQVLLERQPRHGLDVVVREGSACLDTGVRLRGSLLVQYGGKLTIGERTYINEGTEIRCDEAVEIGAYTIVSYEVCIFDTNTHSTDWRDRHAAIGGAPPHHYGQEPQPAHRPVRIGSDCWIGQRAAVLKGASVGDRAIVALGAVVTRAVPAEHVAFGNPATCRPLAAPRSRVQGVAA